MAIKVKSAFTIEIKKSRLELLFEGIFAIALTILVLELKLPDLNNSLSAAELGKALIHHGPTFFSYALSFFLLGWFWIEHNRVYPRLQRINNAITVIHFCLLAIAASFPFCAHLYGRYGKNWLAGLLYFMAIILYLMGMTVLVITAERQKLFDADVLAADIRKIKHKYIGTIIFLAVAYVAIYLL